MECSLSGKRFNCFTEAVRALCNFTQVLSLKKNYMEFLENIAPWFPFIFSGIYGLTEVYRAISLRGSGAGRSDKDKSSEKILWITIIIAMFVGGFFSGLKTGRLPDFLFPCLSYIGLVLMVAGYILRMAAIRQLKQFFTVNVEIQSGHQLIQSGLYSLMRHPSYTGALLMFFAIAICYYNWVSILIIMVPITAAFLFRISVEEAALSSTFGKSYEEYSSRVKRLIPGVY